MLKKYTNEIFPVTIAISNDEHVFKNYTRSDGTPWGTMPDHFGQKHKACTFRAFDGESLCSCIYFKDVNTSLGWVHEAFHATQLALEFLGIELESQGANEVWAYMIEYVHSCIIDFVTEVKKTMGKPLCANPRSICVDCVKRQNCQNADTGVYILKCEEFENDD